MKVDCSDKKVNIDKIYCAITRFEVEHDGNKPSYIIINYETRADLADKNHIYYEIKSSLKNFTKTDTIFGIPVAFNEGLKFGEVDIV